MNPDRTKLGAEQRLWRTATTATGGAGRIATGAPFVASMAPRERSRASGAPAELEVTGIQPGGLTTVARRGQAVFVLCRSPAMPDSLPRHDDLLADPGARRSEQPEYAANMDRPAKPEIAVMVGICTHLGGIPTFRPTPFASDLGASWPGGFDCPCHGAKFELAGRVFKNMPATHWAADVARTPRAHANGASS